MEHHVGSKSDEIKEELLKICGTEAETVENVKALLKLYQQGEDDDLKGQCDFLKNCNTVEVAQEIYFMVYHCMGEYFTYESLKATILRRFERAKELLAASEDKEVF